MVCGLPHAEVADEGERSDGIVYAYRRAFFTQRMAVLVH
jgi:hypothetical protein